MNPENFKIISVSASFVQIEISDPTAFRGEFSLGSYVKIPDRNTPGKLIIGIIENYKIKDPVANSSAGGQPAPTSPSFVIDVELIGTLERDNFKRGGYGITLPPNNGIELLSAEELTKIYSSNIEDNKKFTFSKLAQDTNPIPVPVNGNKFFNKHFAIVGATGSGKSHTTAKILQNAIKAKDGGYDELNNSHIVLFDIHNEYGSAFPTANMLNVENFVLPYWLLNSEELEEVFLDTEANDHNQRNIFKEAVVTEKKSSLTQRDGEKPEEFEQRKEKIHYDSPSFFDIHKVLDYAREMNQQIIPGAKEGTTKLGPLNGKLTNFVSRLENKLLDTRFNFFFGERPKAISFEEALRQFLGYKESEEANITIIDLSGVPFEVLSITVSLISRILFEYGYFYKKHKDKNETPLVLVYEEAHKYVPKDSSARYRASKESIERIAKEGRKYGVTLGIVSQRPSEISETIFSQCNNFIAMRLTNPDDQAYVRRLLPDSVANITDLLPSLQSGEALVLGEAISVPSIVKIDRCENEPASADVPYYEEWKKQWHDVEFEGIIKDWEK